MQRFIQIQNNYFNQAYKEIKTGKKMSHWIWFIFPQIKGLGYSDISNYYGIKSLNEAKEYLHTDILRNNLIKITSALLEHNKINDIFDSFDCKKILSCMTLFNLADENKLCRDIFQRVMKKFFNGKKDEKTLEILRIIKPFNYHYSNDKYNNNNYNNFNDIIYQINQINHKEYPENKYKGKYNNEENNNKNRFDPLKDNNNKMDLINYSEHQCMISQNSEVHTQNEITINKNYNKRRNFSERHPNYSNNGNVKYDNFNNINNYSINNNNANINNLKNSYPHQKTNIKGLINRAAKRSSS